MTAWQFSVHGKAREARTQVGGELLRPAEIGRPSENVTAGNVSAAGRVQRHRARQVADVPQHVFDGYLARVRDPELLRPQHVCCASRARTRRNSAVANRSPRSSPTRSTRPSTSTASMLGEAGELRPGNRHTQ